MQQVVVHKLVVSGKVLRLDMCEVNVHKRGWNKMCLKMQW